MPFITREDFRDVYIKTLQRGIKFLLSKFTLKAEERTKSAFNEVNIENSNWWSIPKVIERWNKLITGDKTKKYEYYLSEVLLQNQTTLLSIGSGVCSHELLLAELNPHLHITCVDISNELLNQAANTAKEKNISNITFLAENIYDYSFQSNYYDTVFFHASLHHFKDMEQFIPNIIKQVLKPNGFLIINEYVGPNRMLYTNDQILAINSALKLIPKKYRSIYKTNLTKSHYYGSGLLRMIIADPSECVDSEKILPAIKQHFKTIEEKPYGGNILMSVLKDISHHFIILDDEKKQLLDKLFNYEDVYLTKHSSDFVFGIYQKY